MKNFFLLMIGLVIPLMFSFLGYQNYLIASIVTVSSLIWPGYLITIWLWPQPSSLSFEKRLCLIPVLSILIILGVSVIYWFAFNSISTTIILLIVVFIVFIISIVRRSPQNVNGKHILILYGLIVFFSLFMTFVSSSINIQHQNTTHQTDELSEFYLVDANNLVGSDQKYTAQIGIANLDLNDHTYTVDVYAEGHLLNRVGPLSIRKGNRSKYSINIPLPTKNYSGPVDIYLYRESDSVGTPFRRLRIWFGNK